MELGSGHMNDTLKGRVLVTQPKGLICLIVNAFAIFFYEQVLSYLLEEHASKETASISQKE